MIEIKGRKYTYSIEEKIPRKNSTYTKYIDKNVGFFHLEILFFVLQNNINILCNLYFKYCDLTTVMARLFEVEHNLYTLFL